MSDIKDVLDILQGGYGFSRKENISFDDRKGDEKGCVILIDAVPAIDLTRLIILKRVLEDKFSSASMSIYSRASSGYNRVNEVCVISTTVIKLEVVYQG